MRRERTADEYWQKPFKWNRQAQKHGQPIRVFCMSLGNWLDDKVPIEWFVSLLNDFRLTPMIDWQTLTKRPENWEGRMSEACAFAEKQQLNTATLDEASYWAELLQFIQEWLEGRSIPENVLFGATIENQKRTDERMPFLQRIPALRRFVSYEPAREAVDFGDLRGVSWLICGGESGPRCRPMNLIWAESARIQCANRNVPFFMKQLGGHPDERGDISRFPAYLQVRQFPLEIRQALLIKPTTSLRVVAATSSVLNS